jgi:hypothetical protein
MWLYQDLVYLNATQKIISPKFLLMDTNVSNQAHTCWLWLTNFTRHGVPNISMLIYSLFETWRSVSIFNNLVAQHITKINSDTTNFWVFWLFPYTCEFLNLKTSKKLKLKQNFEKQKMNIIFKNMVRNHDKFENVVISPSLVLICPKPLTSHV